MGEDKELTKLNDEETEINVNLNANIRSIICLMIEIQRENERLAHKMSTLRAEVARLKHILAEALKENQPRN